MRAVEFKSKPHDNIVDLPPDLRDWNNRPVRVILLADDEGTAAIANVTFKAVTLKTRGFRFDRGEATALAMTEDFGHP